MSCRHYAVMLEHDPETGLWVAYVPDLNNISIYGETREEAIAMAKEAISGYLELLVEDGEALPESSSSAEIVDVVIPA